VVSCLRFSPSLVSNSVSVCRIQLMAMSMSNLVMFFRQPIVMVYFKCLM
jgi:hypothetical protein